MEWNAEKIRELRLRLGFSTSDMARRLHTECAAVKTWESGEVLPLPEQLQLLDLLSYHAEECADEVVTCALAEQFLASDELGQIDLNSVKRRFSGNN
jgi:transcriptional regulator with XRE-family HTH domain